MNNLLRYTSIFLLAWVMLSHSEGRAEEKGAPEIILQATIDPAPTPKPSQFPHAGHQTRMECSTCHHGKDGDGKRVAFSAEQKIEKCETCHNSKSGIAEAVNTYKKAAHALCQDCHKKNNHELSKCTTCHKK